MDQWTSLVEESGDLLAVVAVVVLLVLLLVIRRWRRSGKPAPAGSSPPEALWPIIESYSQSHPHFFKILKAFQSSHSVEQLYLDNEIKEAFERLGKAPSSKTDRKSSTLNLSAAGRADRASEAAMLTILKGIFGNPEYSRELPPEAHRDLDEFLDSLTT